MKNYLLIIPLVMMLLTNLFGEIKNGYERSIPGLMFSLEGLRAILSCDEELSAAQRRSVERNLKMVINHIAYYMVTDKLLEQFRAIALDLYRWVDTLRDAGGKPVDIYLKFLPASHAPFGPPGLSSLTQAPDDLNSCNSEYGERSVSVIISRGSNALRVIAHEFGHILYVVQNMRSYIPFFRRTYGNAGGDISFGHHSFDLSGRSAFKFERQFRRKYAEYRMHDPDLLKPALVQVKPMVRDLVAALAYR